MVVKTMDYVISLVSSNLEVYILVSDVSWDSGFFAEENQSDCLSKF